MIRLLYVSLIGILLAFNTYYTGWNKGYDIGDKTGWDEAILAGKLEITCHFPLNWKKHCEELK
jgi:hypothetical protein